MSAAKSPLMISLMSEPWRPLATVSGRPGLPTYRWLHCLSTTGRRAPRRPWIPVPGPRPEPLRRLPPVPPGYLAASGVRFASTIASGAWPPATVATPAPGKIGGRETLPPPVGYRTPVRRRRSHPPPGLYFWSSFPGGHGILPQCFSPSVLSTAFGPSTHHRRRHPCAGLGSP